MHTMRIVLIADTHGLHDSIEIPDGDLLIHAGDLTNRGTLEQVRQAGDFLADLPHRWKVLIAGNHDFCFERQAIDAVIALGEVFYLRDSGIEIDGKRIWGSPWQPWFCNWAFNLRTDSELREKWDLIPSDTDILVTHGPPRGILDRTARGESAGCRELSRAVERVRPEVHVFGHIHEAYGQESRDGTLFVNASVCTLGCEPVQPPVVIDL
jgi:Icc-related predicted phosphoesterase